MSITPRDIRLDVVAAMNEAGSIIVSEKLNIIIKSISPVSDDGLLSFDLVSFRSRSLGFISSVLVDVVSSY